MPTSKVPEQPAKSHGYIHQTPFTQSAFVVARLNCARSLAKKSVVAHMEIAARREPPGEGEDPVGVHCITF